MCHQVCPEAMGAKVTPGTLTCVSQSAFQLGNKLMFIAVVLLKQRLKTQRDLQMNLEEQLVRFTNCPRRSLYAGGGRKCMLALEEIFKDPSLCIDTSLVAETSVSSQTEPLSSFPKEGVARALCRQPPLLQIALWVLLSLPLCCYRLSHMKNRLLVRVRSGLVVVFP